MGREKKPPVMQPPKNPRKPRRFRPGTVALREIRRYQKNGELLLPKAPMVRIIREIIADNNPELRVQQAAVAALQEAAETYITDLFHDANLSAIYNERKGVTIVDLSLVRYQKGEIDESEIVTFEEARRRTTEAATRGVIVKDDDLGDEDSEEEEEEKE